MLVEIKGFQNAKLFVKLYGYVYNFDLILKERRLRWFGHLECSSDGVRTACNIQVNCRWGPGSPKLTWKKLTENDCRELKLTTVDPQERSTWRSGLRSVMHAASQLTGRV